ncbi:hypothetical protein LOTGIDRAFT_239746 [Lottia gigantea]|uniref:Uncharacterized protein n=1 Tax=Lottia gigantea TaxID=225164 RepID=V4APQ9_LOTGI|nr:hypothetical protein LOTGIDRAFT_239746 [Lottia gigantea]ESO96775.1 hypothetical protein LOTGIDRAFT_239746 [Lottia gigantea]
MAQKGITLYTVGCEPSITPYKEFFTAIAYITGGQYVPLTGAKSLTQIIIGGAQEEMSLEKWMEDVNKEVTAEMEAKGGIDIDEEAVTSKVQALFKSKGARSKQLHQNKTQLAAPSSFAYKMSGMSKLSDINAIYDKEAPAPAPGAFMKKAKKKGLLNSMRSRSKGGDSEDDDEVCAPPLPMASMSTFGDCEDVYEVEDGEIHMEQARRMVQKSKMRNMSKYS